MAAVAAAEEEGAVAAAGINEERNGELDLAELLFDGSVDIVRSSVSVLLHWES
eukprot:CAMPEP_0176299256 /NCGR_PEP_ID=MMETSP0121_2-20121125/59691_1 /TAXON_ID=160619 /ORGANISM="Kryptoperidinium foliaceum, Strain CCMP 1326" /LENGTH=52 /DNA_ID=CAMNT_0017640565 /DNA_START=282 /DNA_END=440 /DNA_ORIENTATION=+